MDSLRQSFRGLFLSPSSEAGVSAKSSSSHALPSLLKTSNLTDTQREALQQLKEQFPNAADGELIGYLKVRSWRVSDAAMQYRTTSAWEGSINPTISDVAGFMRGAPDGCIVCLEDMKGDCARDILGRPIIVSIGMLYGSLIEQQQQMVYALRRARQYYTDDTQIHSNCMVIEVVPRTGAKATFRFPDRNTKQLMEMQKQHFPGTLSSTTHFCGVPTAIAWAFTLCKPFMDAEAYSNMVLRPDFSHLVGKGYIGQGQVLRHWEQGGLGLDFDMESYIQWRAREERVDVGSGCVRSYDPSDVSYDDQSLEQSLLQIPADVHKKRAIRCSRVSKRGGGVGLFSSFKWKEKLLLILPGVLLYFDKVEDEEGSENFPSTAVALPPGSHARRLESVSSEGSGASWTFEIVTPGRAYTFACEDEEDAKGWIDAVAAACI